MWGIGRCGSRVGVLLIVFLNGCAGGEDGPPGSAAGGGAGAPGSDTVGEPRGGSGGAPGEPPLGTVPMFVAQGHAGRTIISCDDGRSWVADRSEEQWSYCTTNDCDHGPGAARGIIWGGEWFFATFGWGTPGSLRRSRDGVHWDAVLEGHSFGGIAYGNGRLVAASRDGRYSDDQGDTWQDFSRVPLTAWNVRDAGFVPHDGGRFIMAARDESPEIAVSGDGAAWNLPQQAPPDCGGGSYQGGIAYGNGNIVMTSPQGIACTSKDGGETWSSMRVAESLRANLVWDGNEFLTWTRGVLHRSPDGETWTATETIPEQADIGVAAISDLGTVVGISNGWQQHYESQSFYRSDDGVHWEALAEENYTGGHPIKGIAFGYGEPSQHCPP